MDHYKNILLAIDIDGDPKRAIEEVEKLLNGPDDLRINGARKFRQCGRGA